MALQSKATFKTQAAAIATALNAALVDTVTAGKMAFEVRDPHHPLRDLEKWVKMDSDGQFTPNDAYFDSVIDNGFKLNQTLSERVDRYTNS